MKDINLVSVYKALIWFEALAMFKYYLGLSSRLEEEVI